MTKQRILYFFIIMTGISVTGCSVHIADPLNPRNYEIREPRVETTQRTTNRETETHQQTQRSVHTETNRIEQPTRIATNCSMDHFVLARDDTRFKQGKEWKLCSKYRLIFQADGNLVMYDPTNKPIWSSNTHGKKGTHLAMQKDGNLVIYTQSNQALWSSNTHGNQNSYLAIEADGRLIIYNAAQKAIWHSQKETAATRLISRSNKMCFYDYFILARNNAQFRPGKEWNLCSKYRLTFQTDGNLVMYNPANKPVWASGTHNKNGVRLTMQKDGNLVIYTASNHPIWSSNTHGNPDSYLAIEADGRLLIYNSARRAIWNN